MRFVQFDNPLHARAAKSKFNSTVLCAGDVPVATTLEADWRPLLVCLYTGRHESFARNLSWPGFGLQYLGLRDNNLPGLQLFKPPPPVAPFMIWPPSVEGGLDACSFRTRGCSCAKRSCTMYVMS